MKVIANYIQDNKKMHIYIKITNTTRKLSTEAGIQRNAISYTTRNEI